MVLFVFFSLQYTCCENVSFELSMSQLPQVGHVIFMIYWIDKSHYDYRSALADLTHEC